MNQDPINSFPKYVVPTPDSNVITFLKVPYSEAERLLETQKVNVADIKLGFAVHKLFTLRNGQLLFEQTLDKSYYFLFLSQEEWKKYLRGDCYWSISVHFDKDENVYASFNLKADKAAAFIDQSVKRDSSFSIQGNSLDYILYHLPNGNVCYLTHRIKDFYDGYWFVDSEQFSYIFKQVFNP